MLIVSLCIGCSGTLTSRENAPYLGEVEDITDYDTPPSLVSAVRPEYPEMARELGVEGRVVLRVLVLEDGTVGRVQVIETPNPILVDEAITAVRKSMFFPATRNGIPCCGTMTIPFIFDKQDTWVRDRAGLEADDAGYVDRTEPVELPTQDAGDLTPGK
jgi:TonB family protein